MENKLASKIYLNEREAAELTGRALSTLRNERHLRRGIPYLKVGGRTIRYKISDVLAYMEKQRIAPEETNGN